MTSSRAIIPSVRVAQARSMSKEGIISSISTRYRSIHNSCGCSCRTSHGFVLTSRTKDIGDPTCKQSAKTCYRNDTIRETHGSVLSFLLET